MDKYILIERFFENTLTEDEKNQFELLLANDTEFAEAVAFEKQLQSAIHLNNRANIKSKLQQFEAEQKVIKMSGPKWYMIAAGFLVIVASTVWILFQRPDAVQLYASYYEPYPNVVAPITRSITSNADSITQYAFFLYENKNYADASVVFNKIFSTSQYPFSLTYLGICNLEMGNISEAIKVLQASSILKDNDIIVAKWYLAMAYLKNEEPLMALPLVKEISLVQDHPLNAVAENLYTKLKAYE